MNRPGAAPNHTGGTRTRKDRPPIGRFLLLFGGLLATALVLAALTPDAPRAQQRSDVTEPSATDLAPRED